MVSPDLSETVNGRRVIAGWGAKLAAAQRYHPNVRVRWDGDAPGRDCAAARGQLHVPTCCLERCPRCDGQLITCGCDVVCDPDRWHEQQEQGQ